MQMGKHYRHLTAGGRKRLGRLHHEGHSYTETPKALRRHKSAISREIGREGRPKITPLEIVQSRDSGLMSGRLEPAPAKSQEWDIGTFSRLQKGADRYMLKALRQGDNRCSSRRIPDWPLFLRLSPFLEAKAAASREYWKRWTTSGKFSNLGKRSRPT